MLSCFIHVQLFAILWTVACQAPLSMGLYRQEYWSGLPCPPPGDLPNSRIESVSPASSALTGRFFTTEPRGKPSQSYDRDENFINIPKVWGSERFQVGECTCVLGGWHTQNLTWTENPELRSLLNLPLHTSSFGCSFYPLQYPHNKQVNRMKAFPWVLWSFIANYQTWRESLGKPWFVAKLGKSVSNLVPLYLWLALTVRGAVLWGWIFNLWGIQAVSVRTV